ncbi:ABC transporter substrate-binding protein [Streptomyces sp. NPDC047042]|uniref:ABC transporter substrate-binding protein n=1 Tax=Streptomyces sp. NPDC047042 TaxID=3154807 RepID=UPI0033F155F8
MITTPLPGRARRALGAAVATVVAMSALAACGADDAGASAAKPTGCTKSTKIRVALGWIPSVEFGGYWMADHAGYYADQCLDVEFQPGGPNAPLPTAAVAGKTADVGISSTLTEVLTSAGHGDKIVMLGAAFQDSPAALISLAKDPVKSVTDLAGKRICLQDGVQPLIDSLFTKDGKKPDYKAVSVGYDIAPLVKGQCDAYNGFASNQPVTLETQFKLKASDYVVTPFSKLGVEQYADLLFAQKSFVDGNHAAVVKFLRATSKGWADYLDDPAAAAKVTVDKYGADLGLDLAQQQRTAQLQVPYLKSADTQKHGLLWIDSATLGGPMYEGQVAAGVKGLPDKADVPGLLDLGPLTEATG